MKLEDGYRTSDRTLYKFEYTIPVQLSASHLSGFLNPFFIKLFEVLKIEQRTTTEYVEICINFTQTATYSVPGRGLISSTPNERTRQNNCVHQWLFKTNPFAVGGTSNNFHHLQSLSIICVS